MLTRFGSARTVFFAAQGMRGAPWLRGLVAALVLVAGMAQADWWYNVNGEVVRLDPDELLFQPNEQDMLCAALLDGGGSGGAVSGLTPPPGCPAAPPVVVYATDADSGNAVYATRLVVKFWGEGQANNRSTGTRPLIALLKRSYAMEVLASGDLAKVDDGFHPPFSTPPISTPPTTWSWYGWQGYQTLSLGDPQVTDVVNHSRWNRTCQRLFGRRCWSAVFTWELPVRLVVHGGETGTAQIVLTPRHFVEKGTSTLSVRGGSLEEPKVRPFGP